MALEDQPDPDTGNNMELEPTTCQPTPSEPITASHARRKDKEGRPQWGFADPRAVGGGRGDNNTRIAVGGGKK